MEKITYIELVSGMQHFECSRMRATLSVPACAANWRRGHHEGDLARQRCKGCALGALHAGEAGASQSPLLGTLICGRCHRTATRLIGKHLCVSCKNREYEALHGRNGKGNHPTKLTASMLTKRSISYRAGGKWLVRTIDLTTSSDELIVAVLRDERKAAQFGFCGKGLAIERAELEPWNSDLEGEATV